MRDMRPARGGRLAAWPFRPIATYRLHNVRTYVRHAGEPGIHFLVEWVTNRPAAVLGPVTYGLPYRPGRLDYRHAGRRPHGEVAARGGRIAYRAELPPVEFAPCPVDSLDAFLLERYSAFTALGRRRWRFRVWHQPWPQVAVEDFAVTDDSLLRSTFPWFAAARLESANFSPGVRDVWLGRAMRLPGRRGPDISV